MPIIPASHLVSDVRRLSAAGTLPPDAIIVRGYLGSPVDVLGQANRILAGQRTTP